MCATTTQYHLIGGAALLLLARALRSALHIMDLCPCQMVREENKPRTGPPDKKMLFAKSLREIESLRLRQRRRLMTVSRRIFSPTAFWTWSVLQRAPTAPHTRFGEIVASDVLMSG